MHWTELYNADILPTYSTASVAALTPTILVSYCPWHSSVFAMCNVKPALTALTPHSTHAASTVAVAPALAKPEPRFDSATAVI